MEYDNLDIQEIENIDLDENLATIQANDSIAMVTDDFDGDNNLTSISSSTSSSLSLPTIALEEVKDIMIEKDKSFEDFLSEVATTLSEGFIAAQNGLDQIKQHPIVDGIFNFLFYGIGSFFILNGSIPGFILGALIFGTGFALEHVRIEPK